MPISPLTQNLAERLGRSPASRGTALDEARRGLQDQAHKPTIEAVVSTALGEVPNARPAEVQQAKSEVRESIELDKLTTDAFANDSAREGKMKVAGGSLVLVGAGVIASLGGPFTLLGGVVIAGAIWGVQKGLEELKESQKLAARAGAEYGALLAAIEK